jgi:hypothetical protein
MMLKRVHIFICTYILFSYCPSLSAYSYLHFFVMFQTSEVGVHDPAKTGRDTCQASFLPTSHPQPSHVIVLLFANCARTSYLHFITHTSVTISQPFNRCEMQTVLKWRATSCLTRSIGLRS